jgi:hypothetical protein
MPRKGVRIRSAKRLFGTFLNQFKHSMPRLPGSEQQKTRYAVAGNSKFAALVTSTQSAGPAEKDGVHRTCSYDEWDCLLDSGDIEVMYIGTPSIPHK